LIIASVTGFGPTGPLSQAAGLDQVAQGMSGLMSVTGADQDHRYRVGLPVIDIFAGVFTAFGVASALAARRESGRGATVATSLLESALAISTFQGQRYLSTGEVPVPQGNDHPVLSPYGVFQSGDIPIIIAVGSDKQWLQLCQLLQAPDLAEAPEYRTGKLRTQNRDRLKAELEHLLEHRPGTEWVEQFRTAGIPAGPIYDYRQAFEDPQVKHLDMVRSVYRHDGTVLPLLRGPLSIDGHTTPVRKAPPALGEDTRAVLSRLELTTEQIEGLIASGIVLQTKNQTVEAGT
jgi:CoA:oxalate CoA-transferase